jgi:hypothetical protein
MPFLKLSRGGNGGWSFGDGRLSVSLSDKWIGCSKEDENNSSASRSEGDGYLLLRRPSILSLSCRRWSGYS